MRIGEPLTSLLVIFSGALLGLLLCIVAISAILSGFRAELILPVLASIIGSGSAAMFAIWGGLALDNRKKEREAANARTVLRDLTEALYTRLNQVSASLNSGFADPDVAQLEQLRGPVIDLFELLPTIIAGIPLTDIREQIELKKFSRSVNEFYGPFRDDLVSLKADRSVDNRRRVLSGAPASQANLRAALSELNGALNLGIQPEGKMIPTLAEIERQRVSVG